MKKVIAIPALLLAAVTLTGCGQIMDTLHKESEVEYASYEDWADGAPPTWVPEDSTDVRYRATTDAKVQELRVVSASDLPAECSEATRLQLPPLTDDWVPESFPDTVSKCGDWEVMPMVDGWFGWYLATD